MKKIEEVLSYKLVWRICESARERYVVLVTVRSLIIQAHLSNLW